VKKKSRALVAHASNPGYSGGRDQEDGGLKPAQANSFSRPYLENTHTHAEKKNQKTGNPIKVL
jgi:hypothetical protein